MKKRVVSLILALAILASLMVAPVEAWGAGSNVTSPEATCPCGCGKTLSQVEWIPYDPNTKGDPASGHYYLADNYIQKEQHSIISGSRVVLDLRGCTLTTDDYHRLFLLYGYLGILDTVGGGRFSAKTTGAGFGGVIMVSTNETNDTTLELYSGTITPDPDNKGSRRGGLIHLSASATFRMYGGRLLAGSTYSTANPDIKEPGGCIAAVNADTTVEILGGEIIGGRSAAAGGNIYSVGTTVLKNCRIIGGEAATYGGNICQNGGSLTMENCHISDGVCKQTTNGGGNICMMSGAVMNLKNSTVRNGYSAGNGGNIYMGNASGTMENTVLEAGVAAGRGNNLYGSTDAVALTVKNCQIPGDAAYIGKNLKLEGLVKIGLLNNGLKLHFADGSAVCDASSLTEGSEIYVDASGTFTQPGANADYFKGAMRTVLSQSEEGLVATQAADGAVGGYCPHCQKQVTWQAFSRTGSLVQNCLLDAADDTDPACTGYHLESGHYYLTEDLTKFSQYYVGIYLNSATQAVKDFVLDLNGHKITAFGRAFYTRVDDADGNNNMLSLLDSCGNGSITGSGSTALQGGGVIYNDGAILNIYGGTYKYALSASRVVFNGGVIYNGDTVNLYGGILDGSTYAVPETDPETTKTISYKGGAYYQSSSKTFTMRAGCILGGSAWVGGGAYFGSNGKITVTGGHFMNGTATLNDGDDTGGGNLRFQGTTATKNALASFTGCSITGGDVSVAKGGGNVGAAQYTLNFEDCYIAYGTSTGYGGNINCGSSATVTCTDSIIHSGVSTAQSANIHVASTSTTLNMTNCLVTLGKAGANGGNITCGNGYINIFGGEISFGTSGKYGGNVYANAGNYSDTSNNYTRIQADSEGNAPLIAGGTAKTAGGNVYNIGVMYLDAAHLVNGTAPSGQDIYQPKFGKQTRLELGSGVTGSISMFSNAANLGSNIYGDPIAHTVCGELNASITLEGYGNPMLCVKDGALCVGAASVVDSQGNEIWYADNASAVAACQAGSYVKLYTDSPVVLTKDCAVDLNGHTAAVSGAYEFSGMDSAGGGSATLAQETRTPVDFSAPNGSRYLTMKDGSAVTYHTLNMNITGVSLRPSQDGVYYTAKWDCDDTVMNMIQSYGVAVSLKKMPDANFQDLGSGSLWTAYSRDTFVSGENKTSAMISGIMKTAQEGRTAEKNHTYGNMDIYANAYVILTDGTVLMGQDDVAYSLYDVMTTLDGLIETDPMNFRVYTNPARAFYEKWQDFGMGSWEFNKIPKPADDGVLDILMIGGSFNYYYVEELYGLAEAAGIPMRVCNLYYSGAGPKEHWTWWKNGETPCQFYNTDGNGRVGTYNVGLEWALAQDDWDVLHMQYPSGTVRTATAQEGFDSLDPYASELAAYLKEQFPDAQFYWQQVWAYQVGYDRNGYAVETVEEQTGLYERHKELAILASQAYGAQLIPSGDAWQIVRAGGYDGLCARLGKGTDHEGDYYHEGDIGGGQYLNACVWFEMLTGQSAVGSTYRPTYTYNNVTYGLNAGITYEALQNAAHQAVENLRSQEAEE